MTSNRRGDDDYTAAEKRLLLSALRSESLDSARVRASIELARRELTWWRRYPGFVRAAGAASLLLLVGAVAWIWDGEDTDDIRYGQAIAVLRSPGAYSDENLLAGIGKVRRELAGLVRDMRAHGQLPKAFLDDVRLALSSASVPSVPYLGDFEALRQAASERPLRGQELAEALEAIVAGVGAAQSLELRGGVFPAYSRSVITALHEALEGG